MDTLSVIEIEEQLQSLINWDLIDNVIEKRFEFNTHSACVGFLVRVAMIAEKMDHHPNWSGVYNQITLRLSTHDAGGITMKDISFAKEVDSLEI